MIWLPLGQLLALLTWPFLAWLLGAAQWLGQVPGAYTTLPPFSVWWVWGYYAVLASGWWWTQRMRSSSGTQLLDAHHATS